MMTTQEMLTRKIRDDEISTVTTLSTDNMSQLSKDYLSWLNIVDIDMTSPLSDQS